MFFGMGPLEILIIGAIALVVIGPEKFPDVAKVFFKTVRDIRGYWDDVKKDVADELKPVKEEVNQLNQIDANKYIDNLVSPEQHDADGNVIKSGIGDFENDDDDYTPTEEGEKLAGQSDDDAYMDSDYPGSEDIIASNEAEEASRGYGPDEDQEGYEPEEAPEPYVEDQDSSGPEPYNPEEDFHAQDETDGGGEDGEADEFSVEDPERLD